MIGRNLTSRDPIGRVAGLNCIDSWSLGDEGYAATREAWKAILAKFLTPAAIELLQEEIGSLDTAMERIAKAQVMEVLADLTWWVCPSGSDQSDSATLEFAVSSDMAEVTKAATLRDLLRDLREGERVLAATALRAAADELTAVAQPVDHNPAITDAMVDALLRAIDGRIEELGAAVRPCSRHELARVGLRAAFRVWMEAAP